MPKVNKITKNLGKMNLDEPEDQVFREFNKRLKSLTDFLPLQDIKPNLIKIEPENADSVTFNSSKFNLSSFFL